MKAPKEKPLGIPGHSQGIPGHSQGILGHSWGISGHSQAEDTARAGQRLRCSDILPLHAGKAFTQDKVFLAGPSCDSVISKPSCFPRSVEKHCVSGNQPSPPFLLHLLIAQQPAKETASQSSNENNSQGQRSASCFGHEGLSFALSCADNRHQTAGSASRQGVALLCGHMAE